MFKQYLDTDYDISEDGQCFSHKTNKLLKPQMTSKYPTYNLTFPNGIKKKVKIHRMVAETFLPKISEKTIVNHIDGDTHNFNLSNLEWVTESENSQHAINTGLKSKGDQNINKFLENLPNENWKPILGYPNYIVSSLGRVMNVKTKRLLKSCIANNGYLQVNLWKNNKGKNFLVHRLVYSNFMNDYDLENYVINHIDGDKTNSALSNLEKITRTENNLHAEYLIKTHNCAKPVLQLNLQHEILAEFVSISSATKELGISNISRAIKQGTTAGGFYWRFKEND